jgi:hypothetical protein
MPYQARDKLPAPVLPASALTAPEWFSPHYALRRDLSNVFASWAFNVQNLMPDSR